MREIIKLILLLGGSSAFAQSPHTIPNNKIVIGKTGAADKIIEFNLTKSGASTNPKIKYNNSTQKLQISNDGTTYFDIPASDGGYLSARFTLEDAIVPYTSINGPHYQTITQSLSSVKISILNSGTSGSTQVRVNQYRSGSLLSSATASISASSGNPVGTSASLSGSLSLLAGDVITVDVVSVAGGAPENLTVEY